MSQEENSTGLVIGRNLLRRFIACSKGYIWRRLVRLRQDFLECTNNLILVRLHLGEPVVEGQFKVASWAGPVSMKSTPGGLKMPVKQGFEPVQSEMPHVKEADHVMATPVESKVRIRVTALRKVVDLASAIHAGDIVLGVRPALSDGPSPLSFEARSGDLVFWIDGCLATGREVEGDEDELMGSD